MLGLRSTRSFAPAPPLRQLCGTPRTWGARHLTTGGTVTEVAPEGPPITETNREFASARRREAITDSKPGAEATLKRFWKNVAVDRRPDGVAVKLDQRTLRTPGGKPLVLPKSKAMLATLIAHEWDVQERTMKHHSLPMTSLASRAIDDLGEGATRDQVRAALLEYLDTDTIWYVSRAYPSRSTLLLTGPSFFQDEPPPLVVLQDRHWEPLLDWARSTFGVEINKFESLLYNSQPEATKTKFDQLLQSFDAWEMAGEPHSSFSWSVLILKPS
ncbi:hypothetical protein HWV62_17348 [Athelia sp. TMB]|nr:hypothetical protein HWV62_17348 [Athelia sp. TMB]